MNAALAEAALSLVGTPFRLHGRDPATGLDCVGLVAAALERCGRKATPPRGYTMRTLDAAPYLGFAAPSGLTEVSADADADVVLATVHALQPHLLIVVPEGFVHAHAGIGRVTVLSAPLPWPVSRQWRLCPASKD